MTKLFIPAWAGGTSPKLSPVSPLEALLKSPDEAIEFENRIRLASGKRVTIKGPCERMAHGRRASSTDRRRVIELRDAGKTYQSIADEMGFSLTAVWRMCN